MGNDARGGKIALVSHCILNQNAVVGGLARFPAMVPHVAELLATHGFGLVQMPCPEMCAAGIRRWGQVREQYQSAGFRRAFRRSAVFTLDLVEDYVEHGDTVILVGILGSPSCGVFHTESNPVWGGSFTASAPTDCTLVEGSGAFMEELQSEIHRRGWEPFPSFELSFENGDSRKGLRSLAWFLKAFDTPVAQRTDEEQKKH